MKATATKSHSANQFRRPTSQRAVDVDAQIGRLARKGAFENSGEEVIAQALKAGRSVTILEGADIVRLLPNGEKEIVKTLPHLGKAS